MKTAAVVAMCLGGVACSAAPPATPERSSAVQVLTLRVGESATAFDGTLRVGIEGIAGDSRCPSGEQCVWAGDASVRIWLQQGNAVREVRELHTARQDDGGADARVRLLRLQPAPVSGKVIAQQAYVVTLELAPQRRALDPDK